MFGKYLRKRREQLKAERGRLFSLRQVAGRAGIKPAYLSKVEQDQVPPPSEGMIFRLANELELDPDELLGRAGKIPELLRTAFQDHPSLVRELAEGVRRHDKATPLSVSTILQNMDSATTRDKADLVKEPEVNQSPALWGKEEAQRLLIERGYTVEDSQSAPNSNSLSVTREGTSFTVWPKTSWKVRLIRLGTSKSLERKGREDFFFGFVPEIGAHNVSEGDELFIVRGDIAREDGLFVEEAWLAKPKRDGTMRKASMGPILKDNAREPHREIWDKWTGRFKDGWEWLT